LRHWQICSAECNWIKFLKYKFSAFMSFYLDNEIPDKPFKHPDNPNQLAGSTLGRFIRMVLKGPRSYEFRVGILMLKKGLPKPGKSFLEAAIEKTKEVLTTRHPVPESVYSTRQRVFYEAGRTVREVFTRKITDRDLKKPYVPSIRANYTDSRSEFGTFGTLRDMGVLVDVDTPEKVYKHALVRDEEERIADGPVFLVNPKFKEGVSRMYENIYDTVRVQAQDEKANVTLVALPEALKVRVISKGPALTYFVLKPVQKFLHKIMRKFRVFSLIGKTVDTSDLLRCFTGTSGKFHSLDYESATDLLDPEFSARIVDEICDSVGMPSDIRSLFHKALTGHAIEGVPQLWGQLMGSIVSFIVLCIANFSVVRHALEITNKVRYSVEDCPALVNGDDGLVRAADEFLPIWKSIAASIGLKPSIGKVYTHETYCNINSASFLCTEKANVQIPETNLSFERIPFVNMGLVNGNTRSGKKDMRAVFDPEDNDWSMGARHHELMRSCPAGLELSVHELYLSKNKEILRNLHYIPWYLPESMGGVGLKPLIRYEFPEEGMPEICVKSYEYTRDGHKCGPSKKDVMGAYALMDRTFRDLKVGKIPSTQPVQARPVWSSVIYNNVGSRGLVNLTESEETFLDLSTFFTSPSAVAVRFDSAKRLESIRRNERAWRYLSSNLGDISDNEDLFL